MRQILPRNPLPVIRYDKRGVERILFTANREFSAVRRVLRTVF